MKSKQLVFMVVLLLGTSPGYEYACVCVCTSVYLRKMNQRCLLTDWCSTGMQSDLGGLWG